MARPLPLLNGTYAYPLRAADLSLADHVGRTLATATGEKLLLAARIYCTLNSEAKGRADFVASCTALGVQS